MSQKKDCSQQAQADELATAALLAMCVLKGVNLQVASTDQAGSQIRHPETQMGKQALDPTIQRLAATRPARAQFRAVHQSDQHCPVKVQQEPPTSHVRHHLL